MTHLAPHPPLREFYGDAGRRERYVRNLFDDTAPWYDTATAFLSFGSGHWYRRQALLRGGLKAGDRLLDLATGTGVVARAALAITKDIVGADPSIGMLRAAPQSLTRVNATSEALPFADASFDFITIGFALRHFADLDVVFRECRRVLRPGGRILILEITAPRSPVKRALLGVYMGMFVPALITAITFRAKVGRLMRYYWATTRDSVRPDVILVALRGAGFEEVRRDGALAIFSEYSARLLPASPAAARSGSAETRAATSPDRPESR